MDAWGSGYVTDIEYGSGFYREQAPHHLRLTCLLFGVESASLDEGFTYCELGCGTGTTSLILAAANPQGRFVAVDFNPAHILQARELARASGLTNIEFHECGFDDLANGRGPRLPECDFITLHGVYSWVGPDTRASIVRVLAQSLKPGGVVYVSYNAMPGWASGVPVQRLLYEVAEHGWERSDRKMQRAIDLLARLMEADAAALKDNRYVKEILKHAAVARHPYLVHEYLNAHWRPLYHAEVAQDLAAAKLTYVGSSNLLGNFPEFMLTPAQREIVAAVESPQLRETLFDICVDRRFRSDVFIRGRRSMSQARQSSLLKQVRLMLMVPRARFETKLMVRTGEANLSPKTYIPIADALAQRPHTAGELLEYVAKKSSEHTAVGEIVATLVGSEQAMPLREGARPEDQARTDRLNRVLLNRIDAFDPNSQVGLAVAALGTGIHCNFAEALVLRAQMLRARDVVEHAAGEAMRVISLRGEKVLKDGRAVDDEAEALEIVRIRVRQVTEGAAAMWQKFFADLSLGS